jgi:hypothetical protein
MSFFSRSKPQAPAPAQDTPRPLYGVAYKPSSNSSSSDPTTTHWTYILPDQDCIQGTLLYLKPGKTPTVRELATKRLRLTDASTATSIQAIPGTRVTLAQLTSVAGEVFKVNFAAAAVAKGPCEGFCAEVMYVMHRRYGDSVVGERAVVDVRENGTVVKRGTPVLEGK